MKSIISNKLGSLLAGSLLFAATPILGADAEAGFQKIFNGKDLAGWNGHPKLWSVRDGVITGQTTAENPAKNNTFLIWTNGTVEDFELRCSYKITANNDKGFANSGIGNRSKVLDPAYWVVGGYQADMEAGATYSGILYEERMSRGIMAARGEKVLFNNKCEKEVKGSVGKSEDIQAAIKKEDWNEYVVIARGNHLQHFINGHQTVDVTDDCADKRAASGVLALQIHKGESMTVQFKNIRIKKLSGGGSAGGDDLKKLQGVWRVVGAEANGNVIPSDDLPKITVTIKNESYSVVFEDRTDTGKFTLDSSKKPGQMDIRPETGPDAGKLLPAIYELSGNSFRTCYGRPNRQRPASFVTGDEAGQLLVTYKREKSNL